MDKPLFDVVLIARNEEETLPRLLGSLKEFLARGGECIVVDTGSTDNTVSVASRLGCRVVEVGDRFRIKIDDDAAEVLNERFVVEGEAKIVSGGDSIFDFSAARNYAASVASSDIISMPDCDEIFTRFDIDAINDAIRNGAEQLEYDFVFSHDEYGKEAIKFSHSKFYNRKKMKWTGVIHEVLAGPAIRTVLPSDVIKLEHFQNTKTDRSGYLKGLAVDCFYNPKNDRNSHYFGRELLFSGRPKSAIQELLRHVAMKRWAAERSQSLCFIGEAFIRLGNEADGITAFQEAYNVESSRREPLIRLAKHYYDKRDARRTAAYAMAALTIPPSYFYYDDVAHYTHLPHEMLYWAFWELGDKMQSKEHFRKALSFQPENPRYLHDAQFYPD